MIKKLDLLLVNPGNLRSQFGGVSEYATIAQPLGITMLASFVREHGFSVEILDAEVMGMGVESVVDYIVQRNPCFVGLTAFTTKMTAAEQILALLKEKKTDIKTIIGGHHPSAIPEFTKDNVVVDFVVKGEGYVPLLNILGGDTDSIQHYERLMDVDSLPLPAWDLLPMNRYRAHHWQTWNIGLGNSFAVVYTGLGCPFQCSFCSVSVVYGKRVYRPLSPSRVMDNLRLLHDTYHVKHVEFIDDTFTLNKNHVYELCDLLVDSKYDFNIWCFSRSDLVDSDMMSRMKNAGINWVFIGAESGSNEQLESVRKHQNIGQIKEAVDVAHGAGMHVGTNYIFGLPDDDMVSMQRTLDLALELCTEWSNFFIAMPYPGTEMYLKASPGDLPELWEQYGFFAPNSKPLPTKFVSSRDVIYFRDKAFYDFFSSGKYQSLVETKFGMKNYIQDMLRHRIGRVS